MEVKKTIKPEIRLDSKKRILIVNVADNVLTYSPLHPAGKVGKIMTRTHIVKDVRLKEIGVGFGKKAKFDRAVTFPTYKFAKKASSLIAEETGVHIPTSIIQNKVLGVYPPIGSIIINGKHIKIKAKNGRK